MSIPAASKSKAAPQGYLEQSRDLLNSLVLVLPLLLIYQFGLLITAGQTVNGVDFISYFLARQWGLNGILVFNGLLFVAGMVGVHLLRRGRRFEPKIIVPVALESTFYALLLGTVILLIMRPLGLQPPLAAGGGAPGLLDRLFLSLGAGVNEELVFRLGLFTGLVALFDTFTGRAPAVVAGVVISSVLFSLAHYLGPEQPHLFTFVYRFLAGALFCALFWARGFAVAVYTHAIYDVYVMIFRA